MYTAFFGAPCGQTAFASNSKSSSAAGLSPADRQSAASNAIQRLIFSHGLPCVSAPSMRYEAKIFYKHKYVMFLVIGNTDRRIVIWCALLLIFR